MTDMEMVMMAGRRGGRRAVALLATSVGLAGAIGVGLVVTAGAASAADDRVDLRAARTFTAGGKAGSASVVVERREKGCITVRTGLAIRLADGMNSGQLRVETVTGGQWRPIVVSDAGGTTVVTERTAPARSTLCNRQTAVGRYRVSFADGTPAGSVTLIGQAFNGRGQLIGSESAAARVNGAKSTKKSPTPTKKATPTTVATEEPPTAAPFDDPAKSPLAVGVPIPPSNSDGGGFLGTSGLVMVGGLVLVAVGAGLIVFLVRQVRADRAGSAGGRPAPTAGRHATGDDRTPETQIMFLPPMRPAAGPGGDQPTTILPRIED